jgi:hypothetical protein
MGKITLVVVDLDPRSISILVLCICMYKRNNDKRNNNKNMFLYVVLYILHISLLCLLLVYSYLTFPNADFCNSAVKKVDVPPVTISSGLTPATHRWKAAHPAWALSDPKLIGL